MNEENRSAAALPAEVERALAFFYPRRSDCMRSIPSELRDEAVKHGFALADELRRLQAAAGQPPAGFVLVPTSPTVEMIRRGHAAYTDLCEFSSDVPSRVYGAMLAARPEPTRKEK